MTRFNSSLGLAVSSLVVVFTTASQTTAQVFGSGPSDPDLFTNGVFDSPASVSPRSVGDLQQLNVSDGGEIAPFFIASSGSEVNISGGSVGGQFDARDGSEINISGGLIGPTFEAFNGSEVTISGGFFGGSFTARLGSDVQLVGGEFQLNGEAHQDNSISTDRRRSRDVYTGTLQDGSPFIFSHAQFSDTLNQVGLVNAPLPAADLNPIVISTPQPLSPRGLRAGQTLTLQTGGEVGSGFKAVNATLNIEGGSLGNDAALAGSRLSITGGSVGGGLVVLTGSEVHISGGAIGDRTRAANGGEIHISGGSVGNGFEAGPGSTVNFSGGSIGSGFRARFTSEVNLSGGSVGADFQTDPGSTVQLIGGEFRLNGEAYQGSSISISQGSSDAFTGTLRDGSPFVFSAALGDRLTNVQLTNAALPAVDLTPIAVNTALPAPLPNLRAGQSLTLQAGGEVDASLEVTNAVFRMAGGRLGGNLIATNSRVTMSGGSIDSDLVALSGSTVNLSGGSVGDDVRALSRSVVNISGGSIEGEARASGEGVIAFSGGVARVLRATGGGRVSLSGGSARFVRADTTGVVRISGGSFGSLLTLQSTRPDGKAVITGGDFRLNGIPVSGSTISLAFRDVLTGTLQDGSAFIISRGTGDRISELELTEAALPAISTTRETVSTAFPERPSGLRSGQTLTLQAGGELAPYFEAVDATLDIEGGTLGEGGGVARGAVNLTAGSIGSRFAAYSGSEVNISGGSIGEDSEITLGSELNLSGGTIGAGSTVSLGSKANISGGSIGPRFAASLDSEINISGGSVGRGFFAVAGSEVNISGGAVGPSFAASQGAKVNVSGGSIDFGFGLGSDSEINITGGSIGTGVRTRNAVVNLSGGTIGFDFRAIGTVVNVSGGSIGRSFRASSLSEVNLSGGFVDTDFQADRGSKVNISGGAIAPGFIALAESEVNLLGTEFFIDGVLIGELTPGESYVVTDRDASLTGTLADGSVFSFTLNSSRRFNEDLFSRDATLTVTLVPESTSVTLLALAATTLLTRRRPQAA